MSRYFTLFFILFSFLAAQDQINSGEGLDTLLTEMPAGKVIQEEVLSDTAAEEGFLIEDFPDTSSITGAEADTMAVEEASEAQTFQDGIGAPALVREEIADTTLVKDTPAIIMTEMLAVTDSTAGLDYGYKGYPWGTPNKTMWPRLKYMGAPEFTSDSTIIHVSGLLEGVPAKVFYAFSDSGFWKVEIDYDIAGLAVEDQVKLFTTVEKNLAENYGKIKSTSRNLSGPHSNRSGFPVVKFKRAYYHSSWSPSPCKIELVLFSLNQTEPEDLKIINMRTGFLRLVYYNPDFMVVGTDEPAAEKLPTIFELY